MTWMTPVLVGLVAAMLGAVLVAVLGRRRFAGTDGAFRCRIRMQYERLSATGPRWCRGSASAIWVHDVLVVQYGLLPPRTVAVHVRPRKEEIRTVTRREVRRLGAAPVLVRLELDDGRSIDVAARATERMSLVGPFLAAALPGMPEAPTERRPRPQP
jgi:hypothetical protein